MNACTDYFKMLYALEKKQEKMLKWSYALQQYYMQFA